MNGLLSVANELDARGLYSLASKIDGLLKEAVDWSLAIPQPTKPGVAPTPLAGTSTDVATVAPATPNRIAPRNFRPVSPRVQVSPRIQPVKPATDMASARSNLEMMTRVAPVVERITGRPFDPAKDAALVRSLASRGAMSEITGVPGALPKVAPAAARSVMPKALSVGLRGALPALAVVNALTSANSIWEDAAAAKQWFTEEARPPREWNRVSPDA